VRDPSFVDATVCGGAGWRQELGHRHRAVPVRNANPYVTATGIARENVHYI